MAEEHSPQARALLAAAAAAREVADLAYLVAASVDDVDEEGSRQRVEQARTLVIRAMAVRRWRVIAELLGGASWEDVAAALNLNIATTKAQFEETVDRLLVGNGSTFPDPSTGVRLLRDDVPGTHLDTDPEGTAAALDAWLARHASDFPGELGDPGPVTRALRVPARQLPGH